MLQDRRLIVLWLISCIQKANTRIQTQSIRQQNLVTIKHKEMWNLKIKVEPCVLLIMLTAEHLLILESGAVIGLMTAVMDLHTAETVLLRHPRRIHQELAFLSTRFSLRFNRITIKFSMD